MNESGRVRHQYYKGLRVINIISHKELVAWQEIQISFRNEGEDPLPSDVHEILRALIKLYSSASRQIIGFRTLQLGARFDNQRYGFIIETEEMMKKEEVLPFINEMLSYLLSMDTPARIKEGLIDKAKLTGSSSERKRLYAHQIASGMEKAKPEIERFLKMINEEERFVYFDAVLD